MGISHIYSWLIAYILFILVAIFYQQDKHKPGKILHMILRLMYIMILLTGIGLFFAYHTYSVMLFIKVIAGLWIIAAMESVTVRLSKNRPLNSWFIQLIIASIVTITLGFVYL